MSDHDDISEIVEIDFEVGHSSIIRSEATTIHIPPRTHDWKIYLRSADVDGDLNCLIQRCIFHLHPEFPNNKRELNSTPFAIQETGYAGFHLPIEIYFKTKIEPRKFRIEYDLDLHRNIDGHPYRQKESYLQKYRCTFYNPDPEFRQKILAAGGSKIMSQKTKEPRGVCRLVVAKIIDSGPISSNKMNIDEINRYEEPVIRHSPQQKRPVSPVSIANGIYNKKVKLEQPVNNIKKKQVQSMIHKTIVNTKKTKLVPHKSSSVLEGKTSKTLPIKESNQTSNTNGNTDNLPSSKPRTATKLIKSQSTNDIKSSVQSLINHTKKKESVSSPSKTKSVVNSQNILKKSINKNPSKTLIKTEPTTTPTVKSPLTVIVKQESSPQSSTTIIPSNNTTPSVSISNLKKIPKKPAPPKVEEKRSHSLMPSSSSSRDSQKQQTLSSKTQSNFKRDHLTSSVKNSSSACDRSRKTKIIKDQSNHPKPPTPTLPKPTLSPPQSNIVPPINSVVSSINTSQSLITTPPSNQVFQNEDHHIQTSIDTNGQNNDDQIQLSDKSNSPHEQILIPPRKLSSDRISYSDQSDTTDSNTSIENDKEEQDLPTSLTNEDLRYKLIYIYKRFQLNSTNDLIIFVRFFKRHQLIDISSLSTTKTTDEMFTYDLFSLSPSHIVELANDLGYTTMNMINSME